MLRCLLIAIGLVLGLIVLQFFYFVVVLAWTDQQTNDGLYFSRTRRNRARFRSHVQWHARLLAPVFWLLAKRGGFKLKDGTFSYQGVAGPKGACDAASFERGTEYAPSEEDVFVVTQMKCGTTWMQNLVYQVVTRANNDLAESGSALYALSPWLESRKTIRAAQGPLLGTERPTRIIKTHFPIDLCPYDQTAKYIYVARHPVSCFASCVDFLHSNLGRFAPSLQMCEQWYCSPELMWWSPWPQHVAGWWQRAEQNDNVLFVRFEEMKQDLEAVVRQVETFLGQSPLDEDEMSTLLQHCSFQSMSDNFDLFEMQPPHLLQDAPGFFKSGRIDRYRDIPDDVSQRILDWSRQQLQQAGLPPDSIYE